MIKITSRVSMALTLADASDRQTSAAPQAVW